MNSQEIIKETFVALRTVADRIPDNGWYVKAIDSLEADTKELVAQLPDPAAAKALANIIPARRALISSAAAAETGHKYQVIVFTALEISMRFLLLALRV